TADGASFVEAAFPLSFCPPAHVVKDISRISAISTIRIFFITLFSSLKIWINQVQSIYFYCLTFVDFIAVFTIPFFIVLIGHKKSATVLDLKIL
ncbi:MAG: hypothetical protein DRP57_04130, partial [Spirochaetes bacterium]